MKSHVKSLLILPLYLVLLFTAGVLCAGAIRGVEIKLPDPGALETLPGKTLSSNFFVINHLDREETVSETVELPEGWTLLTEDDPSFSLAPGEKELRIIAISVPNNAYPGPSEVKVSVKSETDPSVRDEKILTVTVLPFHKISLKIEEKPQRVVAGLTYSIKARVFNQGNIATRIGLALRIHPDCPSTITPSESIEIDAGSSRSFSITVKTDERVNRKTLQVLALIATAEAPGERLSV